VYVECRKFFQRESSGFLFVFWALFMVLGCFRVCFRGFSVVFHVGMRDV
jgi:hypothetical protein